jgi:hypothetical protein
VLVAIPLLLSGFTHIWNPLGFPTFHNDEGGYIARAIHISGGLGVQESSFYDHPYFGPLLVSSVYSLLDLPNLMNSMFNMPLTEDHIKVLYSVPRIFMGVLAVLDTLLVYKIAQRRYDTKTGLIASTLFAVVPMTWILRRVLLDSIMLPLILLSIFFAMGFNARPPQNKEKKKNKQEGICLDLVLSGIFLGLAVFCKIPAFSFIPLIGILIYRNSNLKTVGMWTVPAILIPCIWPAYAMATGDFNNWIAGVSLQTHRISQPLLNSFYSFLKVDPVLLIVGIAGICFTAIKKDYFLLLWTVPFLLLLYFIGYVTLFHMIPLLPVFSISFAVIISNTSNLIKGKMVRQIFSFAILCVLCVFGLIVQNMLVATNLNDTNLKAEAFIAANIPTTTPASSEDFNDKLTVIADPFYFWIPKYVLGKDHIYKGYENKTTQEIKRIFLVLDWGFKAALSRNDSHSQQLKKIYNMTKPIADFNDYGLQYDFSKYPYNIITAPEHRIEIRTNYR